MTDTKAMYHNYSKETSLILLRCTLGQIQLQARMVERLPPTFWELYMIFM